jgi:Protein of unknown function (DUF3375)
LENQSRLLVADNAQMIVSFLHKTFIPPNVRTMAQPELASVPADYLYGLREKSGEEAFPRRAEQYLDDWAADSRGCPQSSEPDWQRLSVRNCRTR